MALFTKDNAATMGAKGGVLSGRSKSEAERKRLLEMQAYRETLAVMDATAEQNYERRTVNRVRVQLDKVFDEFMDEVGKSDPDASKLDRLASAQARLHEQERQLSNRPLPGTLRPAQKPARRQSEPVSEPMPSPPSCASDTTSGSVPVQPVDPITPQSE